MCSELRAIKHQISSPLLKEEIHRRLYVVVSKWLDKDPENNETLQEIEKVCAANRIEIPECIVRSLNNSSMLGPKVQENLILWEELGRYLCWGSGRFEKDVSNHILEEALKVAKEENRLQFLKKMILAK